MSLEVSRLSVSIPKKKHGQFKKAALSMGLSMSALVELSLDEFLHRQPNEKTEKAIKESLSKKSLKKFKNIEDLFEDLES